MEIIFGVGVCFLFGFIIIFLKFFNSENYTKGIITSIDYKETASGYQENSSVIVNVKGEERTYYLKDFSDRESEDHIKVGTNVIVSRDRSITTVSNFYTEAIAILLMCLIGSVFVYYILSMRWNY